MEMRRTGGVIVIHLSAGERGCLPRLEALALEQRLGVWAGEELEEGFGGGGRFRPGADRAHEDELVGELAGERTHQLGAGNGNDLGHLRDAELSLAPGDDVRRLRP